MQASGEAVARFALRHFASCQRVAVLCGRGNNGGDGMVSADVLARAGRRVTVVLMGAEDGLRASAAKLWRGLGDRSEVERMPCADETALRRALPRVNEAGLIVDAMVGTGFHPPLRGLAREAMEWMRTRKIPVLAVDLPSGWDADAAGSVEAFPVDAVVTFTAPKSAHIFGQLTRRWTDPVVVAPIGSPDEAVATASGLLWAGTAKALAEQPRAVDAHKGSFGNVLMVGGSAGKVGAVAMAAMAAMRTGAGLVTVAAPAEVLPLVAGFAPEMMTMPLEADARELLERKTVVAIGPGFGTGDAEAKALRRLLQTGTASAVIDADALNLLATEPGSVKALARGRRLVLTPHPGEMARLARCTVAEVQADRLRLARRFACENRVTLVLKGWRTIVAHPDGQVAVNTTGNPGMAKGGSGDVLTGIVAGLLAQFPDQVEQVVEAAVCLHGLAADIAVRRLDEHTLLATDTIAALSEAFRLRLADEDGFVWLQGAAHRQEPIR